MDILQNAINSSYVDIILELPTFEVIMSRTIHKQFPAINLCAEESKNKQKNMNRIECCWNITHGRAPLLSHYIQQLKRHKALLRKLSNSSIPIKHRKFAIQRGIILRDLTQ